MMVAIIVKKKTATHWIPLNYFAQKISLIQFWLILIMAAMLNFAIFKSAILHSAILHKTLTQTKSIWLKVIHSHSTWWWQPSWTLAILDSPILHKKNFPYSFSINLMMAAILNSINLNSAILDSVILVFPLKLAHNCQDWFPPFAPKNLHSFILTQLDDDNHPEFYHVEFRHWHLGFRHLVIFSHIHSKTLSLHSDSDSN